MTKNRVTNWALNNGALVGLIALCIALFIATPYFLTVTNLLNVGTVSYTHLTLPTKSDECRSRWSPYH